MNHLLGLILKTMSKVENWSELNATLLVNFLRMPEENQIHLLKSIIERKPDLLQLLIKESRNNLIQNLLEK